MKTRINTLLFDCNGTLMTHQNHGYRDYSMIAKIVELLNAPCSPEEMLAQIVKGEEEYKTWRKRTFTELPIGERWKKYFLPGYPEKIVHDHAEELQFFWSASRGPKIITPETIQILTALSSRGYTLGSVSNSSPKILQSAGIQHLFRVNLHASEYGLRKPHPSIFLEAVRACGSEPLACAFVGDRPSRDVIGSREAGLGEVILLQREDAVAEMEPCPMKADRVIHDLRELLDLFPPLGSAAVYSTSTLQPEVLYDAALSTMWWNKEKDTAEDFFSKGRHLGFARFELNHQIPPTDLASIDLNHYHIGTLHDPCPAVIPAKQMEREDQQVTSLDEHLRRVGVDALKRTIEEAYRLSARSVVIHPGRIIGDHSMDNHLRDLYNQGKKGTAEYEELRVALIADRQERSKPHLEALLKSMYEIVNFSKDLGLSLGMENRFHYYELPIYEEMKTLLQEFQQPWVGWQLDVGHLQVLSELGLLSIHQWLEEFGSRIIGTHLHDVTGIVDHRAPGKGEVDFELIAAYLPPHAQRTLEVDKSQTFEEMRAGLEVLADAKCIKRI